MKYARPALLLAWAWVGWISGGCSSYDSVYFVEIPTQGTLVSPSPTLPTPTETNSPSPPTPTATATRFLSPTPDLRVIAGDASALVLTEADLPTEEGYFFDQLTQISNRIIAVNYRADGPAFLERTGRIEGWQSTFTGPRVAGERVPRDLYSLVELFQTAEGAQIALQEFNLATLGPLSVQYEVVEQEMGLGDDEVLLLKQFVERNQIHHTYVVGFRYRNLVVYLNGTVFAFEEERLSYEFLTQAAQTLLDRLREAPLAQP